MTADRLDPAVIAEWARRSRASQGLPERITDGAVLTKVITLAFAGTGLLATTTPREVGSRGDVQTVPRRPAPEGVVLDMLPRPDHKTDSRAVQERRLAAVEVTRALYGPAADLPPSPAEPPVCPPECPYCPRSRKGQGA